MIIIVPQWNEEFPPRVRMAALGVSKRVFGPVQEERAFPSSVVSTNRGFTRLCYPILSSV